MVTCIPPRQRAAVEGPRGGGLGELGCMYVLSLAQQLKVSWCALVGKFKGGVGF